jgi:hypothetical protein
MTDASLAAPAFGWRASRLLMKSALATAPCNGCSNAPGNRLRRALRRPVRRYERTRRGELLHLDLKFLPTLDRRATFKFAAVNDFSREAVVSIARPQHNRGGTLSRTCARVAVPVDVVMTDNDMMFTIHYALQAERLTRLRAC